jgi:GT2 family glycosyltransferase
MVVDKKMKLDRWAIKVPLRFNNFISSFAIMRKINPLIYNTFNIHPSSLVAYVEVIPGSFFIIKKSVLTEINFLDENVFLYGEEIILGKKVKTENLKLGLSFSDIYLHNHIDEGRSLANRLIHLKYSLKSHLYFNAHYNDKFWGMLDTLLVFIFLPLKILEIALIHWYSRSNKLH